jgi:serine/threonine protein phosphatase PrpC
VVFAIGLVCHWSGRGEAAAEAEEMCVDLDSTSDSGDGVDAGGSAASDELSGGLGREAEVLRSSWPSSLPIVVGRPIPVFEPRPIDVRYRSTPYRADAVLDGWSTERLTVRGASVRGYWHRHDGSPRQDDFAVLLKPDCHRLVVAVADGVAGASQSHIGATVAVRYASQWLANADATSRESIDWKALVENTAWALVEQAGALLDQSPVTAEDAERVLATTLVCAVIDAGSEGELTASVAAVGDSAAWLVGDDGYRQLLGGKSELEGGISSSAVSGLPRVPKTIDVGEVTIRSGDVLLLGTDGFADPLGSGEGEVGRLFASTLRAYVPSIIEFGHMLDFSRETFDDDRTLVAVWPRADVADGR